MRQTRALCALLLSLAGITSYAEYVFWGNFERECIKDVAQIEIRGSIIDAQPYQRALHEIKRRADGLFIIIESGGGLPGASENISREIQEVAREIPVVVFVENICASGAYLAACGAHRIVAPSLAQVGSIGAMTMVAKQSVSNFYEKCGNQDTGYESAVSGEVDYEVIGSSNEKIYEHPLSGSLSEEDRERILDRLDEIDHAFAHQVSRLRCIRHNRSQWNTGEIFLGTTALSLGLIDMIGGHSDALSTMMTLLQQQEHTRIVSGISIIPCDIA